jgi:hypothetical protein
MISLAVIISEMLTAPRLRRTASKACLNLTSYSSAGVEVFGKQSTVLKMAGAVFTLMPLLCECSSLAASRLYPFPHNASSKYDIGRTPSRDKWRYCNLMVTDHLCLAIDPGVRYRWYLFSTWGKRSVSHCR